MQREFVDKLNPMILDVVCLLATL